jgi:hypothetical protein
MYEEKQRGIKRIGGENSHSDRRNDQSMTRTVTKNSSKD